MSLAILKTFRHETYGSFGHAKDAMWNTVDALLSEDRARSFPELSLSHCLVDNLTPANYFASPSESKSANCVARDEKWEVDLSVG